jgi:hypothetical protein
VCERGERRACRGVGARSLGTARPTGARPLRARCPGSARNERADAGGGPRLERAAAGERLLRGSAGGKRARRRLGYTLTLPVERFPRL